MVDISITPWPLLPGDRLILASDGVDSLFIPAEMTADTRAMLETRTGNLAADIVEACRALEEEHADNVTVVTLDWM